MSFAILKALKMRPILYNSLTAQFFGCVRKPTAGTPSGALTVLPNELLNIILEYAIPEAATTLSASYRHVHPEHTPLSLLLTCRRFRTATEWVLYNRSTLILNASPCFIATPRFAPFSTLCKALRFGPAIRRLLRLPLSQEHGGLHRFRYLRIDLAPMSDACLRKYFNTLCDFMRPIAKGHTHVVHTVIALVPASNTRRPSSAMHEPWLISDFMDSLQTIDQSFDCDLEWAKTGQWSVEPPPILLRAGDDEELEETIDEIVELLKLQMDVGEGIADLTGRTRLYSLMLKHVYSHRHISGSRFDFSLYGMAYERTYVLMPDGERKQIVGTRGDKSWKKWQKKCDEWENRVADSWKAVRQFGWELRIDGELYWREKYILWNREVEKLDVKLRATLNELRNNFWDEHGLTLYEAEMVVWETESLMALEARVRTWETEYLSMREEERRVERLRRAETPDADVSSTEAATRWSVVGNGGMAVDHTEQAVDGAEETIDETWSLVANDGVGALEVQMKWRAGTW